jgi:hypothetical protein
MKFSRRRTLQRMDKTTDLRLPWEEETDTAGKVKRREGKRGEEEERN